MYFVVEFLGSISPNQALNTNSKLKREVLESFVFEVDESTYKSVVNYIHSRGLAYNYREIFNDGAFQKFDSFNLDVNSFETINDIELIYLHNDVAIQVFDYQLNGNNPNAKMFRDLLNSLRDNPNILATNLIFLQK